MDTCCHCGRDIPTEDRGVKDVRFEYDGSNFAGKKNGMECTACKMIDMKAGYELLKMNKIFKREVIGSEAEVDWPALHKYISIMGDYPGTPDAVGSLVEIGILSFYPDGNYAIVAGGIFVYLFDESFHIFFTRAKDAKECAGIMYGKAEYPWSVIKVEVIMSSERGAI
jgi:hypothetical protein